MPNGNNIVRPTFSILHTSARPDQWEKVYRAWIDSAHNPDNVEYVLVVDHDWGFTELPWRGLTAYMNEGPLRQQDKVMWQRGSRHCYVEGVNRAAASSTGQVLIVNADDQYPCENWDLQLLWSINENLGRFEGPIDFSDNDFTVLVSTGTKDEHIRRISVVPILSRARYEKYGHVFYPLYESMFADNDFLAHARHDGVVIEAKHLLFPHRHPFNSDVPADQWDEQYKAQNKQSSFQIGQAIFDLRRNSKFGDTKQTAPGRERPTLAICLPGESYSQQWVTQWTEILCQLGQFYNIKPVFAYTTNVYTTRAAMAQAAKEFKADYIVWIDDDNLVAPGQIQHLIESLDKTGADMVAGWCWIIFSEENVRVSCGWFDGVKGRPYKHDYLTNWDTDIVPVDWTGFPVVVMKGDIFTKLPPHPFLPLLSDEYPYGHAGEDVSFCYRVKESGLSIFVDRTVKVPHLKRKPDEPANVMVPVVGAEATTV